MLEKDKYQENKRTCYVCGCVGHIQYDEADRVARQREEGATAEATRNSEEA